MKFLRWLFGDAHTVKSAGLVSPDLIVQELEALWAEGSGETPTWKWNRAELYGQRFQS
jgi:hypothetical protein